MPAILDSIVAAKREEIAAAKSRLPEEALSRQAAEAPPLCDFLAPLRPRAGAGGGRSGRRPAPPAA